MNECTLCGQEASVMFMGGLLCGKCAFEEIGVLPAIEEPLLQELTDFVYGGA